MKVKMVRVRCPLCGMLVWPSQVQGQHSIDTMIMTSLGRGRGFKFMDYLDTDLISLVKAKIKSLYERFFESPSIQLTVPVSPALLVNVIPALRLFPSISLKTKVKMVE